MTGQTRQNQMLLIATAPPSYLHSLNLFELSFRFPAFKNDLCLLQSWEPCPLLSPSPGKQGRHGLCAFFQKAINSANQRDSFHEASVADTAWQC